VLIPLERPPLQHQHRIERRQAGAIGQGMPAPGLVLACTCTCRRGPLQQGGAVRPRASTVASGNHNHPSGPAAAPKHGLQHGARCRPPHRSTTGRGRAGEGGVSSPAAPTSSRARPRAPLPDARPGRWHWAVIRAADPTAAALHRPKPQVGRSPQGLQTDRATTGAQVQSTAVRGQLPRSANS